MPTVTDEYLIDRIDPALAVDRALNAAERAAFFGYCLTGRWDGAQPADWISEADNADAYLDIIEPWWERYGDKALAYMLTLYELPEALTRRLLTSALYATCAITSATLGHEDAPAVGDMARRRTHIEIACGAALWARGYAEALGWAPSYPV
jgi:hypothetical protein